ncbi:hypothetical protein, partial [Okeania sp. SIO3B5]|uniref:hypothetical protein n=1 Tax=Okeania sp. SIO3B5 TaxID=2607811 RepID=UPI0025CC2603
MRFNQQTIITTVGTLHATSLLGFAYGDVVHKFEKRCQSMQVRASCPRREYLMKVESAVIYVDNYITTFYSLTPSLPHSPTPPLPHS